MRQVRGEWNYVCLVNGKQCVVAIGVAGKLKWCVNNLDMGIKVIFNIYYTSILCYCIMWFSVATILS